MIPFKRTLTTTSKSIRIGSGSIRILFVGLVIFIFVLNSRASRILQQQQQQQQQHFKEETVDASILVQLSGEMGNNLNKIAFGRGLQLLAKEEYGISTKLIFRHQDHPKWKLGRKNIQKCFPKLKSFDFEAGNSAEFSRGQRLQAKLFGSNEVAAKLVLDDETSSSISPEAVLDGLSSLIERTSNVTTTSPTIRLPIIHTDRMVPMEFLDRFKDDFYEFFEFDDRRCCLQRPEADESVFHFRNFLSELKGATDSLGFQELSPERTANELFSHLKTGDKVAITTRFNNAITKQYVEKLELRGIHARVVSGQTAVQDFCFLKSAQKELVGLQLSTFFHWAAYLSNEEHLTARSYSIVSNNPTMLTQPGKYDWNDKYLKRRFHYSSYNI